MKFKSELNKTLLSHQRIIVALDTDTPVEATRLVSLLHGYVGGFKIGLELLMAMITLLVTAASETEANF